MGKYNLLYKQSFLQPLIHKFDCVSAFFLIFVFVFFAACTGNKMSVEEAKKVTILIGGKQFVPPPRCVDDIAAILDQPGNFDPNSAKKIKDIADAPHPDTDSAYKLHKFYVERGRAARSLGRYNQFLEDFRIAVKHAEKANMTREKYARILVQHCEAEFLCGNYKRAIDSAKRGLDVFKNPKAFYMLAVMHFSRANIKTGKETVEAGLKHCKKIIKEVNRSYVLWWENALKQLLYRYQGQYALAEPHIRHMIKLQYKDRHRNPGGYLHSKIFLAQNLKNQGRLVEAELETRKGLTEALGLGGKASMITLRFFINLVKIKCIQERLEEADKLTRAGIKVFERSNLSLNARLMADANILIGNFLTLKSDFTGAMERYDKAKKLLAGYKFFYDNTYARNRDLFLSLLKTNRIEEGMSFISSTYDLEKDHFGKDHPRIALLLGLRGMAYAMKGSKEEALKDFSKAVPILIDGSSTKVGRITREIIETYINLLADINGSALAIEFGIDALAEAFRLTEVIRESSVKKALGASGARAAAYDPELAELVRSEQDAQKQIEAFEEIISNCLAAPPDQQNPLAIQELKAKIDTLIKAKSILLKEIKNRFPKYSDFINPEPATVSAAQEHLRLEESLISAYAGDDRTYVWAIPQNGKIQFSVVPLGKRELQKIVSNLRKALTPELTTFGDIPSFDLNRAYELYNKLLKPVEDAWKNAKDLVVVAPGPLGQLPFSLLPVASFKLDQDRSELFSIYRKVPWLIRKFSIARQPSVSSFVTLRKLPDGDPNRKAFVGFGDPCFNKAQLAQAENEKISQDFPISGLETKLNVRGIRITELGNLDSPNITTSHIGMLNRLPDTAEEIRSIAQALKANPATDIFLGKQASEHQVKTMNLSNRRVIAFATHALLPGDLDGLDQPALALSSALVTDDNEDGLLTMAEILQLRFNADWVVLSACNTGAAHGAGTEAISGLGRAFFYAGTRSILVSMWPVETTSARKLTTALFQYQKENNKLSRARALRKSVLSLIDSPGLIDNESGKIVASYAHPLFWAPFIIVGDNGGHKLGSGLDGLLLKAMF